MKEGNLLNSISMKKDNSMGWGGMLLVVFVLLLCLCCIGSTAGYLKYECNGSGNKDCFCGLNYCTGSGPEVWYSKVGVCNDGECKEPEPEPEPGPGSTSACTDSPCLNGGTCSGNASNIAVCDCSSTAGFSGVHCEKPPAPDDPCVGNTTCEHGLPHPFFNGSGRCECTCNAGWTGDNCEIPKKLWTHEVYNPSGTMMDTPKAIYHYDSGTNSYNWECNAGFYGNPSDSTDCKMCSGSGTFSLIGNNLSEENCGNYDYYNATDDGSNCSGQCRNGSCTLSNKCRCTTGFYGARCQYKGASGSTKMCSDKSHCFDMTTNTKYPSILPSNDKVLYDSNENKICNQGYCDVDVLNNSAIDFEDQKLGYYGARYKLSNNNKIVCNSSDTNGKCLNVPFVMENAHCKAGGDAGASAVGNICHCSDRIVGSLCHIKLDDLCGEENAMAPGPKIINDADDKLGGFYINASGQPEPRINGSIYNVSIGEDQLDPATYNCQCNGNKNRKGQDFTPFTMDTLSFCNAPSINQQLEDGDTKDAPWVTMYLPKVYGKPAENKTLNNMFSYLDCGRQEFTNKGQVTGGAELETGGIRTGHHYSNKWNSRPTCKVCEGHGKNQIKVSEYYGYGTIGGSDGTYTSSIDTYSEYSDQKTLINDLNPNKAIISDTIPENTYLSSDFGELCTPAHPEHYGTMGSNESDGNWAVYYPANFIMKESDVMISQGGESIHPIDRVPDKPVKTGYIPFERTKFEGTPCADLLNHAPTDSFAINSHCEIREGPNKSAIHFDLSPAQEEARKLLEYKNDAAEAAETAGAALVATGVMAPLGAALWVAGMVDQTTGTWKVDNDSSHRPSGDVSDDEYIRWGSTNIQNDDHVVPVFNSLKAMADNKCKDTYGFRKNGNTETHDKYKLKTDAGPPLVACGDTNHSCPFSLTQAPVYVTAGLDKYVGSVDSGGMPSLSGLAHTGKAAVGCSWHECPDDVCT